MDSFFFGDVISIVFVVNLTEYDQVLFEDEPSVTRMTESLSLFKSVVNSQWFGQTSIILFLNNVSHFKQKIVDSPLSDYFPDYFGGNDGNEAAKYILSRFNQINSKPLDLYSHFIDPGEANCVSFICRAMEDTVRSQNMKSLID